MAPKLSPQYSLGKYLHISGSTRFYEIKVYESKRPLDVSYVIFTTFLNRKAVTGSYNTKIIKYFKLIILVPKTN